MGLASRVLVQTRRLLWLDDEPASGNAFLALGALTGVVGWATTLWAIQLVQPVLVNATNNAGIETAVRWTASPNQWLLVLIWALLWGGRFCVGYLRVERKAVVNGANLVWVVLVSVAFVTTAFSVHSGHAIPVWAPWLAVFAVGYLGNGLQVERSWVYLGPGVISAVTLGVALYGRLFVVPPGMQASQPVEALFGSYTFYAFLYVLLAVLHVLPMAVDAYLGGREVTDVGLSAIEIDRKSFDAVPSDD